MSHQTDQSVECQFCNFCAPTRRLWLSHLRRVHGEDKDFSLTCEINNCRASYTNCASFVSHVYRQHKDTVCSAQSVKAVQSHASGNSELGLVEDGERLSVDLPVDLQHAVDELLETDEEKQQKMSALYLLDLKEISSLSQSAVDHIVSETQHLFQHAVGRIQAGVDAYLSEKGVDLRESQHLDELFSDVKNPFEQLHSTFLQEKFYREKLGCMDPVEVKVGSAHYVTRFTGSKRQKVLKADTFQYIPVEDTLRKLLSLPDVIKEIETSHCSEDEVLRDMCDGSFFKTHPLFSIDRHSIQIIAYFDEVELCNPLGSSTKKHKLGCLFFTIGNLRTKFRSKLKCIFVAALASSLVIRNHGMNMFLRPFVESMQSLGHTGITVYNNGEERSFRVGLLAVLADTLAAHALGGFKESMSFAYRICRTCMATTEQIQTQFCESDFELRTPENHLRQVQTLSGSSHSANSTKYGINSSSELLKIPNFSVVKSIPHDIMHDLFEGVVPYEMKLLLTHLIFKAKYFSVADINDRIRRFDFGYIELSDKPALLDARVFKNPDQKIRQSASKLWLLAIFLPLIIGDLVPENCKLWNLYTLLLRICSIATSWNVTQDTVSYLSVLIEEHHTQFKALYPDVTIIPKMHYMVHYPSQIRLYGPLIYSWTMRHEAKLSVIKRSARHGNFKNICFTVAKRSQHALCYHLNCGKPFLASDTECSKSCTKISIENESTECRDFVVRLGLNLQSVIHPTWIKNDMFLMKKFAFVYLGNRDLYPSFGKVVDLYKFDTDSKLIYAVRIQRYETLYYDSHFSAFAIDFTSSFFVSEISSLPAYPLVNSHRSYSGSQLYLVLKQYLM